MRLRWNQIVIVVMLLLIFFAIISLFIWPTNISIIVPIISSLVSLLGIVIVWSTAFWKMFKDSASNLEGKSNWRAMLYDLSEIEIVSNAQINKLRAMMRYEKKKNSDKYVEMYKHNSSDISKELLMPFELENIYGFDLMTTLIIFLCDEEWKKVEIPQKQIDMQFQIIIRYLLRHHWESQQNGGGKKIDDDVPLSNSTIARLIESREVGV